MLNGIWKNSRERERALDKLDEKECDTCATHVIVRIYIYFCKLHFFTGKSIEDGYSIIILYIRLCV